MNAVHNLIAAGFGNAVRPCAPPGVALSPYSTIDPDQVGKIPMQPGPHGWTGFTGWTGEVEPQPDTWASWHPDIGAGVVTRNHPTIDADILDERAAAVVEGLVYERFGHGLLKRVGLAPKAAFIGRLEGEPFPKTAITFTLPGGSHEHVIEVLGNGQYVNLDAIHPKTGRRYELDPPIEEVVASELAPISKAGIEGFLAECRAVLSESLGAVFDDQGAAASQGQGAARQEVRNRLEHDPVVQILKKRGEFLRHRRDGGVDVLCPWRHEHSSTDKGTASTYWPAYTGGFASPAYVCKHAHCTHRGWPEFKEAIGYQEPKIQIHAGEGEAANDDAIMVDLTGFADFAEVERPRFIDPILPARAVTLLAGHGGTGKSSLALVLGVHIALGLDFAGLKVKHGKVLFYSCEDDGAELRSRLARICRNLNVPPAELMGKLTLWDMTQADPVLYTEDRGKGITTWRYAWLREHIDATGADVLIVDNASDTFDADEIKRARVRPFIRNLAQLVMGHGGAVLLLSHVDKNTAKQGRDSEGYSGSTAWNNSVRSRLLLTAEGRKLKLEHWKANYSEKADPVLLEWVNGIPMPGAEDTSGIVSQAAELARLHRRRQVLALVNEFNERGEIVSASPNAKNNAFVLFSAEDAYPKGMDRPSLFTALRNAQRDGLLVTEQYKDTSRHPRERWVLTDSGMAEIAPLASEPIAKGGPDE